jgi:hypothetical protein
MRQVVGVRQVKDRRAIFEIIIKTVTLDVYKIGPTFGYFFKSHCKIILCRWFWDLNHLGRMVGGLYFRSHLVKPYLLFRFLLVIKVGYLLIEMTESV